MVSIAWKKRISNKVEDEKNERTNKKIKNVIHLNEEDTNY